MTKKLFIIMIGVVLTCSTLANAQKKIVRREGGDKGSMLPDDMFDLRELATIISVQDGKIVVDNVMEKRMRPKENESVDIQQGDVIMMVNGKRVKSLQDLKEAYASVAVGSPVKFGIERNKEMAMISFDKADPEKLPKRRIMINRGDGGRDIMMVPGTGLMIGSKGKEVVIEDMLDSDSPALKEADVKKGDIITAVNETTVTSFKDFSDAFKKIAVGDKVTFHTSRKDKPLSFSFTKAEGGQQRVIKRTQD
jgi:S1-C subfamily serine protease